MSLPREEFTKDVSTVGIVHTDLHSISMQHYLRQEKPEGNHVKIVKEIQLYGARKQHRRAPGQNK